MPCGVESCGRGPRCDPIGLKLVIRPLVAADCAIKLNFQRGGSQQSQLVQAEACRWFVPYQGMMRSNLIIRLSLQPPAIHAKRFLDQSMFPNKSEAKFHHSFQSRLWVDCAGR